MRRLGRRGVLAGAASYLALYALHRADAGVMFAPAPALVLPLPQFTIPIDIDYGQSWRSNAFDSFADFGLTQLGDGYAYALNPQSQTLITPKVSSVGSPTFLPGPLPNSAGIALGNLPVSFTGYSSADEISIGRCSVIAEQCRRTQLGFTSLTPIMQFCAAYPSSGWTEGPGGGLGPGCTFVGSVTDDVLTVTEVITANPPITTGQKLVVPGVATNTFIIAVVTGTGGVGTYTIAVCQTVLSELLNIGSAVVVGSIGGGTPSNVLTVTEIVSGTIVTGATVTGTSVTAGSRIFQQLSGTTGGIGTYQVLVGSQQNFASQQMSANGVSWANMLAIIETIDTLFPKTLYPYLTLSDHYYRCVKWTQGGSADLVNPSTTVTEWTEMTQAFDALDLRGTSSQPLNFFCGIRAGLSTDTDLTTAAPYLGIAEFVRANANGRTWGTTPWYQWPFEGPNEPSYGNIHTGPYGSARHGEFEGLAVATVYDEGLGYFYPLWLSLTKQITRNGQVVTVPFDRPSGAAFADGVLAWMSTPTDGIKVWPQYGWQVYRNGVPLTVTPVISGMDVLLNITETINTGDELEVSYAMYGPGGTNPGLCSGVGGNLMMAGPPSLMFPGQTINAWAWQFVEDITA